MTNKKELLTLELDESLVERISEQDGVGMVATLKCGVYILISGDRIGVFSKSTVESFDRDFSKISTIDLALYEKQYLDLEDFPDVSNSIQ